MKTIFFLSSLAFAFVSGFAQNKNIAINTNGAKSDSSAILDISSTDHGVLIPRMNFTSRNSIAGPANGLLVYQTSSGSPTDSGLFINTGSASNKTWVKLLSSSSGWSTGGNSGTNPQSHFLGTTDNTALEIRVNNQGAGEIDPIKLNTYWGFKSGVNNFSKNGNFNTGIGYQALYSDTTGSNNTANGANALFSNTTGNSNTAVGASALQFNTTGTYNTAIGNEAMNNNITGSGNTVAGAMALNQNTTGGSNTAYGGNALFQNTTGNNNSATGTSTMYSNTTGSYNTAMGFAAALKNSTGSNNTAIGAFALSNNTTGSFNTAIGDGALQNNNSGQFNVAIGISSGVNLPNLNNTIAIGYGVLINGSNVVAIGSYLDTVTLLSGAASRGDAALVVGTNSNNGNGAYLGKGGIWTNASDKNIKENITELNSSDVLDKINKLSVTRWKYKGTKNEYHIGPMAQDFYAAFKLGLDDKHISTIDPSGVALVGIQELNKKINSQEKLINSQEKLINSQEKKINSQGKLIAELLERIELLENRK